MTRFYPNAATDVNFPTIRITGGAHTESEIERILKFIHIDSPSMAGYLIIQGILDNGDSREGVTIVNPHGNLNNAFTSAVGAVKDSDQPDSTAEDLLRNPGHGSGGRILYYPWEWHQIGGGRAGAARDEILLHELVHAYMQQRGLSSIRNLHRLRYARRLRRFDIVDDFFAVMITNVYASECGRPIRRDHHGFQALNRNAMSVISDPRFAPLFKALEKGDPDLVKQLKAIDTPFNPWNPKMDIIDATSVFDDA